MIKKSLHEKCGIIGVYTASGHAPYFIKQGLSALQHRGQESAGISVLKPKGEIRTYKNMGLVPIVISEKVLKDLGASKLAIGHNRYATSGGSSVENAQPIEIKKGKFHLTIGHNGNIPDVANLRQQLKTKSKTTSDTILVANVLLQERPNFSSWEETLAKVLPDCRGAYNFVMLTNDNSLFGIRDPYGIWSLSLGKLHDGWVIASESVAFDAIGAEFVRDVLPGEIIKISSNGQISSTFFGEPKHPQHSLFEYVYFARPDSFINGKRVRTGREMSGKLLGERIRNKKIKPDLVVPVFESGYPAAKGVAKELSLPIVDAITTSNYVGRTFIQPGQDNRVKAVNGKHNIVPDEILGKKIVVVDDSAVRLTTSQALIQSLKEAGATEVYMGIASPPVVNQCDLGIDMRSRKDLPASRFQKKPLEQIEENIAELIGADALIYLPIDDTAQAMGRTKEHFYWYPFGGPHPIRGKQYTFSKLKKKLSEKIKICVMLSGNGTFVQDIIDGINEKSIDAEISTVLSNNPDAFGLTRAKKNNIPTSVIPYLGKLKDNSSREKYEEELLAEIKKLSPDVILLSNWRLILSDNFFKKLQSLQIPVLNHHPALLRNDDGETIETSRGTIPVVKGLHAWDDAFAKKLPVSGVSVHQVLPGNTFDSGPIIIKAEVRLHPDDTFEKVKKRMDDTEHLILPTAIKRVIHVLKNGIDISKGDFSW